ncbi:hypothetical protein BASA81_010040 [Batrachochytrium salamandrivorans]|nr:hypothetical protein BASA81_010040 [Batrachochytrium salamandrivorans]
MEALRAFCWLAMLLLILPTRAGGTVVSCSKPMEVSVLMNEQSWETTSGWYSTNYPNSMTQCLLLVPGSADFFIQLSLLQISTEANFDLVRVYSVRSFDSLSNEVTVDSLALVTESGLGTFSLGGGKQAVVGQPGQVLLVVLSTDAHTNAFRGYRALVSAKLRDCYAGMQVISLSYVPRNLSSSGTCLVLLGTDVIQLSLLQLPVNYELAVMGISDFNLTMQTYTQFVGGTNMLFPAATATAPILITSVYGENMLLIQTKGRFTAQAALYSELGGADERTSQPTPYYGGQCPGGRATVVAVNTTAQTTFSVQSSSAWCFVIVPPNEAYSVQVRFTKLTLPRDLLDSSRMNVFLIKTNASRGEGMVRPEDIGPRVGQLTSTSFVPSTFSGPKSLLVQFAGLPQAGAGFEAVAKAVALPTLNPTLAPTLPTPKPTSQAPSRSPTTNKPTKSPKSSKPTKSPSWKPTSKPTKLPSRRPSKPDTNSPTYTRFPTRSAKPTRKDTKSPTYTRFPTAPTKKTAVPTVLPTLSSTFSDTTSSPKPVFTRYPTPDAATELPTTSPFASPTARPSIEPTLLPSIQPTLLPSIEPTLLPSIQPTLLPSIEPTLLPSIQPTLLPSIQPTLLPSIQPTLRPTTKPTPRPTTKPTLGPTTKPTLGPTTKPTPQPTTKPTLQPTTKPTPRPTTKPSPRVISADDTSRPSFSPTWNTTVTPTRAPTKLPTGNPTLPTLGPTKAPTKVPTAKPTQRPSKSPTLPTPQPTAAPTKVPTQKPTQRPSKSPTLPTLLPTVVPSRTPTLPTAAPTKVPTKAPTQKPTQRPSKSPTLPTSQPTTTPTKIPTLLTLGPTKVPTKGPTPTPTLLPTRRPSTTQPATV